MTRILTFMLFTLLIFIYSEGKENFSDKLKLDYKNYYIHNNYQEMGSIFLIGGIMANSNIDQWLRDNYQEEIIDNSNFDTDKLDDASAFFKLFGEKTLMVPIAVGSKLIGSYTGAETIEAWGDNVTRVYLVGVPALLIAQRLTGASRPEEVSLDKSSYWNFLNDDNGVSGHAFMGAVPFLVAGNMTDNPYAKSSLYFASTLTAVSRVHDDKHFVSQAILGWYMSYSTVRSIFKTNKQLSEENDLTILPIANNDSCGIYLSYNF